MKNDKVRYTLKPYRSEDHPAMSWAVTGPATATAKRWRKLFATREEAESFLQAERGEIREPHPAVTPRAPAVHPARSVQSREEKIVGHRSRHDRRIGRFQATDVQIVLGLFALILVAFLIDRAVQARLRDSSGGILLTANFEANPLLSGWIASNQGVDWTSTEHPSGRRSIMVQSGEWSTPPIRIRGSSWYRVGFQTKAERDLDRRGRCSASFVNQEDQEVCSVTYAGVARLASWQANEFYLPCPHVEEAVGDKGGLRMRISFPGDPNVSLFIDDVVIARVADEMAEGTRQSALPRRPLLETTDLIEAGAEFETDPEERAILGETFRSGSIFELQGMTVHGGEAFSAPDQVWPQLAYQFPEFLDLRDGDITVYWAFRADRQVGEEAATLLTFLNFTDTPPSDRPEPARIAAKIRSVAIGDLYVDPGWEMEDLAHLRVVGKEQSFLNPETVEKFRMQVRLVGTNAVASEIAWWNRAKNAWEGLLSADQPENGSAIMSLDVRKQLLGHTSFRSLFFQVVSEVPKLDTILVTRRPLQKVATGSALKFKVAPVPR